MEAELRRPIKRMPGKVAENLFSDPEFKRLMNRWSRGVHFRFAVSMAFLFIGINYFTIWLTQAFTVPPQYFALTFFPAGIGLILHAVWKDRKPKQSDA